MTKLVGRGSNHGSTWFGRTGDTVQQPPAWLGIAGLLTLAGERGRRAALRGSACYSGAHVVHLVVKVIVGRRRPPGAGWMRIGPASSSFPSGHAASDLAFSLGAAQEIPALFIPFSVATLAAHWSLIRSRGHYVSDVFAGGVVGSAVALAAWLLWPPAEGAASPDADSPAGDLAERLPGPTRVSGS